MPLGVRAQETSIGALFAPGGALAMPPYQRSYSWTEKEALELLGDLSEASNANEPYFIGAIVVVRGEDKKPAEIVDGQQRLTTLTILLACLRDLTTDRTQADEMHELIADHARPILGEEPGWRLRLNHLDGPFFQAAIQERGATRALSKEIESSASQSLMIANARAMIQKLRPMAEEDRQALFETVRDHCAVVRVLVDDRSAGFGVFRVLNTRGKKPNAHDIIKTDLFERAGFDLQEADQQSRIWSEHESRLGGDGFDDLLRQIRSIYDRSTKGDLLTAFRRNVLTKVPPRVFLNDVLKAYVRAYEEISCGKVDLGAESEEVGECLNRLRALDHLAWRAPALKFLVRYREDPEGCGDPLFFFANLERLGYVIQLIISDRAQRSRRYRRVMDGIDAGKNVLMAGTNGRGTTFSNVTKWPFSTGGPFDVTREESRRVRERLKGRFTAFGQRRAIALRLNATLEGGETLPPEADATVEHVLPRNPEPDSHWLIVWPISRDRQDLCDSLGNFVLLPHTINQKADRLSFQEKKQLYFNGGGAAFALTHDLIDKEAWTADVVRRRRDRLADILCDAWGLSES